MQEVVLGVERLGAVLPAVAAVREDEAGLRAVAELGIKDPAELGTELFVLDRAGDLDTAVQVSGHKVGRSDVHLGVGTTTELVDAGVLEEASDDGGDVHVLGFAGDTREDAADATDDELHLDACAGCLCELIHDLTLGDRVRLDADISVATTCDLLVDLP